MKVSDFCTYAPKSPIKAGEAVADGEYMFFTSSSDENKRYSDYQLDCEGIIMGTGGNATLHYYNGKFATSTDCVVLLPNETIRCKYLYYYFLCNIAVLEAGFKGAGLKHTNKNYINSIELPNVPPLEEQDKVIEVLDKVQAVVSGRITELSKLDDLIKARFVEMFGDPIVNSKHLPTIRGDLFFKLSNGKFVPEEKRFETGVPVYGGNGISWYTDEILVDTDTLVVGRVGFQSGNVHYAKGPLWVSDNAMYISNYEEKDYDLLFLCHLMEHIDFTRHQDAGDLKKITQKPFMAMEYIHPSLQQQQKYTAFVKQVDKSKVVEDNAFGRLKYSLMPGLMAA